MVNGFNHRGQGTARKQPTFRMQLLSERGISKANLQRFWLTARGVKGEELFEGSQNLINLQFVSQKLDLYHKNWSLSCFFLWKCFVVSKFFYPWDEIFFILVSLTTMVSEFRTMFFVPHFFNKSFHLFNNYLKKSKRNSKKRIELLVLERYDNDHWT